MRVKPLRPALSSNGAYWLARWRTPDGGHEARSLGPKRLLTRDAALQLVEDLRDELAVNDGDVPRKKVRNGWSNSPASDGPAEHVGVVRIAGQVHQVPPAIWRLLRLVWTAQAVPLDRIIEDVWARDEPTAGAIKALLHKTNNDVLPRLGLAWQLSQRAGVVHVARPDRRVTEKLPTRWQPPTR